METLGVGEFYKGKRVFVSGYTGFKGSWLCWCLRALGAEVTGFSLPPEDIRGNLFNQTLLKDQIAPLEGDVRDLRQLKESMKASEVEIVFHLAAQSLVLASYEEPVETFDTNVMGTINVLEAIKNIDSVRGAVLVTTDKCYENKEWEWAYRENDRLGGYDPYAASKAMAELAIKSYRDSFLRNRGIASARAGNVIGGGDYARYRIIPDIIEAVSKNVPVVLRNPEAVRPWQHVLDVIYGYLLLGKLVYEYPDRFSTSYNFGPGNNSSGYTVKQITEAMIRIIGKGEYRIEPSVAMGHETTCLRLDSSRAMSMLKWRPHFSTADAIEHTARWYLESMSTKPDLRGITINQIKEYLEREEEFEETSG